MHAHTSVNLRRLRSASVLIVLVVSGCSRPSPGDSVPLHPDILIVLPGARNVQYQGDYDGSVSYQLDVAHPATEIISQVRARLEQAGWKAAADDMMNPGEQNSHVRGWANYIDGTKGDARVFIWAAAWDSPRGDRVEYWLKYEYPKDSGPLNARPPLQVNALYFTAPTVNGIREQARRRGDRSPGATDSGSVLKDLEQRLAAAWVNGDRTFIYDLLADDWTVTDPAGRVLTKQQVLNETFSSKERRIDTMAVDEILVRMLDDAAVVTGRTRATGSYRGQKATAVLRFTDIFLFRDGRWQIVASHGTTVQ
jgi:ketosteroid isomerase-like protein